jgi:ABC-type branched-subunit amino acid transport system ATPase component
MNITVEGLYKEYNGTKVLDIDKLEFNEGSIYAVLGLNGSGKTTLLECIAGINKPDGGIIRYDNDQNIEDAAYSLSAGPIQTFFRVTLPLSAPGIISGCILVFTMSMTSYVTPKLLGGSKFRMMSTMVFQEVNINFNWGLASAISYILLFTILIILLFASYATAGVNNKVGGGKRV